MGDNKQKKIIEFEAFVNDVLKSDLAKLAGKLDSKNEDMAEYIQLKSIIKMLQSNDMDKNGFKTKVDIGNNFYIQAHVPKANDILLDIGLGYYVEFTLEDALTLSDVRIKLFEKQITNLRKEIAKTNAYIKWILLGIRELQGLD